MFMMEFDLSGAEWVVVAYLANDPNMLNILASGKSPHVVTGSLISGASEDLVLADHELVGSESDPDTIVDLRRPLIDRFEEEITTKGIFFPRTMSIRQAGKKSNHGLNYGLKYRNFALHNEIAEKEAMIMVQAYTTVAYPGIPRWWESTVEELRKNDRTLVNCFGRKVRLLGEWGPELFNQAYSFKPQSTVVDCCNEALILTMADPSPEFEPLMIGAQVHDSIQVQYPEDANDIDIGTVALRIGREYMRQDLSYNGHTFRLETDMKVGYNWGDMEKVKWNLDPVEMGKAIRSALSLCAARAQTVQDAAFASALEALSPEPLTFQ